MPNKLPKRSEREACITILDTFDPKKTTVDAHCEASPVMKKVTEVEQKFIKQV